MGKYVFISYKAEDFERADRIRKNLNSYGIDTWMAPSSISGGASYASEIPKAIQDCSVFLLIMTANTQKSKWVPREVDQAINENKQILPYFLEKCTLESEFKFYLTNVQSYYAYEKHYDAFEMLVGQIARSLNMNIDYIGENKDEAEELIRQRERQEASAQDKPAPVKKPAKEKKPKKSGSGKKFGIAVAAILAVIVLLIVSSILNRVTIAGKKFKKSETSVILSDVTLSDEDIMSFLKFKELHSVSLADCTIQSESISSLLGKVKTSFSAVNCGLTDSMLESADLSESELISVVLTDNEGITSLSVFAPVMSQLTTLDVSGTSVKDLSALDGNILLNSLGADRLGLEDIAFLSQCSSLKKLSVNSNRLTSVELLSNCPGLIELKVNDNQLVNLAGLEKCLKLTSIEASGNNITDISGLKNATVLKSVNLSGNRILDLAPLENSKNTITVLFLANCEITQLAFNSLPKLPELTVIGIDNNYIEDISLLSVSSKLESITAHGNLIANADVLLDKTEIKIADLSDNKISSLYTKNSVGFGSSQKRVTLDIRDNGITGFFLPCHDFRYLLTSGNAIENMDFFKSLSYFDLVEVDYSEKLPFETMAANGYRFVIAGCPLDKQLEISSLIGESYTSFNDDYTPPADCIPEEMRGYSVGQ